MRKFDVIDKNLKFKGVWKLDNEPITGDLILLKGEEADQFFFLYSDNEEEIKNGFLIVEELNTKQYYEHVELNHRICKAKMVRR